MEKVVNIEKCFEKFHELFTPKIIAEVNGQHFKIVRLDGDKIPWHTHEGPGPRYVVKGKLKVIEGGKINTYTAGQVFWESGHLMSVENMGEDSAELIIFELAPMAN